MQVVGYILVAIIILVTLGINIKLRVEYDILANLGKIKIKIFHFIPILSSQISFVGEYFRVVQGKKVMQIKFYLKDENIRFIRSLRESLSKKIYIQNISSDFCIGFEDPNLCSVVSGYIHTIMGILLTKIKAGNSDAEISKKVSVNYFQKKIDFQINFQFVITLFDCLSALINAFYKSRREVVQ